MAEAGKLVEKQRQQDITLLEGVAQYARMPGWLASIKDSALVCRELAREVPEFRTWGWELKNCDVSHVLYKSEFWTALYQLTVRKPGAAADTVLNLQGRIFPPGKLGESPAHIEGSLGENNWRGIFPVLNIELRPRERETVLSALDFLTQPEASRQFLETQIRSGSPVYQDLQIKNCIPNVVRYKPGSRCTVVYHLEYDPGLVQSLGESRAWPELVVAKTYHGEKGRNAFESMSALWNSPLGSGEVVKLAEPLAYQPENKILIQGPIREEQTLKSLLYTAAQTRSPELLARLDHFMRKTAAALAALHHSGVESGHTWDWKGGMEEVQDQVSRLAICLPHLRAAAGPFLDKLNRLAAETPAGPPVPSHGTFRPAQVLIHQDEIGFIDFDSFCQAEPANDLALFLGTVFTIGLTPPKAEEGKTRAPLDARERQERFAWLLTVHDQFLEEYQRSHPVSRQRVVLWEALNIFMFVLHGWTKVKLGELDDTVYLLEQFLAANHLIEAQ